MFTLTAIPFEQEICLSVQKDVPTSWMNPQIQFFPAGACLLLYSL